MTFPSSDSSEPARRRTLESWKEIASYLERSVRTVQLWEKDEGLPVHRLQGTVLAYADEIDAWVRERKIAPAAQQIPPPKLARPLRLWIGVAAVVVALTLLLWPALTKIKAARPSALAFGERDSLLIASIENRTNEPVFDGSIEYILERELSNSGFVNVVSSERIADALSLMKRTAQKLDRTLAREVALRDGNVRALAATRIEKIGKRYVIGADLISVNSGERVAAFTRKAVNHDQIHGAVEELAAELRDALGETRALTSISLTPMERVTTRSLRAAQLFTEADRVIASTNDQIAERLLREAIAEDPEFASAYMYLAFAIANQGRNAEEYLPYAEKAVELSKSSAVQERYFILGSHASMRGNYEEALTHYRNLLKLNPDHYWANNNVASILGRLRRSREAVSYRVKLAALRPNQFLTNFQAAESLEVFQNQPEEAEPYYRRAAELRRRGVWEQHPILATRSQLRDADNAWRAGDLNRLVGELDTATNGLRGYTGPGADALAAAIAEYEIALGRTDRALSLARRIENPLLRTVAMARIAHWKGDKAMARAEFERLLALRREPQEPGKRIPILYAESGRLVATDLLLMTQNGLAEAVEQHIKDVRYPEAKLLRGAIEFARGWEDLAMELLRDGTSGNFSGVGRPLAPVYLISYGLMAEILERRGERDTAIALIETVSRERNRGSFAKAEWMHLQRRLAHLHRANAHIEQAERIEHEIREMTVDSMESRNATARMER